MLGWMDALGGVHFQDRMAVAYAMPRKKINFPLCTHTHTHRTEKYKITHPEKICGVITPKALGEKKNKKVCTATSCQSKIKKRERDPRFALFFFSFRFSVFLKKKNKKMFQKKKKSNRCLAGSLRYSHRADSGRFGGQKRYLVQGCPSGVERKKPK